MTAVVLIAVAQVATAGLAKTDHRLSTLVTGRERPSLGTAGSQSTAKRLADVASEADLTGDLTNSGGLTEDGDVAAQPEFNDDAIVIPPVADGSSYAPPVPHGDLGLTAAGETAVFPKDRESVRLLGRSRELIAEGRYAEATQSLGRLMHLDDDFFFQPDESLPTHQSVRSEAARLLDQLPERGRQFYELQFSAEARNELEQALEAGDIEAIAETARRYFHTDAGFEASYLVALDHIDHGRPLLASLILRRMQESPRRAQSWEPMLSVRLAASWARGGELERARQIWRDMRRQYGDVDVRVGGRTLGTNAAALPGDAPHENDSGVFSWLAEVAEWAQHPAVESAEGWLVYRGTPSRNVQTDGGAVLLRSRWRVRTNTDPVLDDMLTQQQHAYHDVGLAPLPAAHPLVVGNVVLTRTLTNLTAVDFETGKRLWESASSTDASQIDELTPSADAPMAATLRQGLEQRVWNDITYGTLASDGNLVFAVEDISLGAASRRALGGGLNRNLWRFWDANPSNRLAAYDVHTGKLTWEVGGDRSDGLAMSDTFFLGPPLPLADKLYVLAERESEIRLWVLDAATGRPDWSQLLVVVEPDRNLSVARRMVGLSPSYADGVLVCPTASGAVVAVDLTTRGLLWGYQYAPSQNQGGIAWQLPFSRVAQPGGRGQFCRWIDGSVTLSDQCVLVAAVESDELHCLELHSGSARWTVSPDDAAFVAGVTDEKVFVVGQRSAQAYRLSDGSAVWDDDGLVFPEEVMPTGRGFLHAGQYFLPTRHGGLASIDLARGELTFDATSTESPELGNLVVHAGSVISATAHGVDRFLQVDAARQLLEQRVAASSNDPDRFALEAELHLHSGRLEAAVATLERGRQVGGGARIDGLLLESLLRGMQTDFQRYRDRCDEIERLLRHPADRAVYYRLLAEGRQRDGDFLGALDAYLTFVDTVDDLDTADPVSPLLTVRRDRWLQAGIASLLDKSDETGQRAQVEQRVHDQFDAALESAPQGLRRFIRLFASHPLADRARLALVSGSTPITSPIETELVLLQLMQADEPSYRAQAMAQLALLYRRLDRPDDAVSYVLRLGKEYPDVVCNDQQTGQQFADAFPANTSGREFLRSSADIWPPGCAHIEDTTPNNRTTPRSFTLRALPQPERLRTLAQLEYDIGRRTLVGRDPLGQIRWQTSLGQAARQVRPNQRFSFASTVGHLAVLTLGTDIYAVNTVQTGDAGAGSLLWQASLVSGWPGDIAPLVIAHAPVKVPAWGGQLGRMNDAIRPVGCVSERAISFVRQRKVVSLDPLTGNEQWAHDGFHPASSVYGDRERLVVAPPDADEAVVLQMTDGLKLGTRRIPPADERMTTTGTNVLTWTPVPDKDVVRLHLYDTWTESDVWSHDLPSDAKADVVGADYVGVMDTAGQFQLFSLDTGETVIATTLEPAPELSGVCLLETPTHLILLTETDVEQIVGEESNNVLRQAVPTSGFGRATMVDGQVCAFDRNTHQLVWSHEVQHAGLRLDQPSASPVLVFVTAVRDSEDRKTHSYRYEVLCLDTRDGTAIYDETRSGRLATYDLETRPDRRSVEIVLLQTHGVTITYQCSEAKEDKPDGAADENGESNPPSDGNANSTNDTTMNDNATNSGAASNQ